MPRLRHLLILLLLFGASGCAALIYEVAWYQVLQLAIGSTSVSLGILLATFMGGLCIGSLALPRWKRALGVHPLRVYAGLELGIGVLGILVTAGMPLISAVYVTGAEQGLPGMLLRGVVAAIAMLPSTILMGASLPAIVRWIENTPEGVSWWALLYGANTAGAVLGCLVAGFYLLRVFDMATAAWSAAALNLAVAMLSFYLSGRTAVRIGAAPVETANGEPTLPESPADSLPLWTIYLTTALSGACALGAEVVWTRLLSMLLLGTVYVFSIILAVFLAGLAAGGAAAAWLIRRMPPALALALCQILLTAAILWTAMLISSVLPFWSDALTTTASHWQMFALDLKRCVWTVLPASLLWGASFPLACAAAVRSRGDDPGRVTGAVYAANTLGGIAGALLVSLLLIPLIGTQNSERLLLVVSGASSLLVLGPLAFRSTSLIYRALPAAALVVSALLAWKLPPVPGELIAYGRMMAQNRNQSEILAVVEGRNSSVAISRWNNGAVYVNVNGHVEATTEPFDMKLQRMVGHLPGLLHPNPKSVLGIGFGAGVSAGTFTRYPGIEHITVCEIEPLIPPTSTRFFAAQDYDVYHNPKTHVVFDDARHFLLTTRDRYDVIASDPLDVFVKGTAALYSLEYFEAVKRHLNAGGYFSLYVPLYETDEATIRSELETFFEAFPNATVWSNTREGRGYDLVFLGQAEPLRIDLDDVSARLARVDYAPVRESLRETGIESAADLFGTWAGQRSDLGQWTRGAEINRDANLRLSYLAGWGINSYMQDYLYRQMLRYRKPAGPIFTGSPQHLGELASAIERESSGQ
jgi:spermidine synthase